MPITTPEQQKAAAEAARKEGNKNVEEQAGPKPAVSEATGTSPAPSVIKPVSTGTAPNVPSTTTSP